MTSKAHCSSSPRERLAFALRIASSNLRLLSGVALFKSSLFARSVKNAMLSAQVGSCFCAPAAMGSHSAAAEIMDNRMRHNVWDTLYGRMFRFPTPLNYDSILWCAIALLSIRVSNEICQSIDDVWLEMLPRRTFFWSFTPNLGFQVPHVLGSGQVRNQSFRNLGSKIDTRP